MKITIWYRLKTFFFNQRKTYIYIMVDVPQYQNTDRSILVNWLPSIYTVIISVLNRLHITYNEFY